MAMLKGYYHCLTFSELREVVRYNKYIFTPPSTATPTTATMPIPTLPPTSPVFSAATVKQLRGPESYAARKHHFGLDQSSSARHEFHDKQQNTKSVDMSQVASIVIGFCVAMMALTGKKLKIKTIL